MDGNSGRQRVKDAEEGRVGRVMYGTGSAWSRVSCAKCAGVLAISSDSAMSVSRTIEAVCELPGEGVGRSAPLHVHRLSFLSENLF